MTDIRVVTVATHTEGLFEDLVNNEYSIDVTVLGYGKKWTGFTMKFKEMLIYISDLPDDTILIFLDGFDSMIKGDLSTALNRFKKMDCKVLFSKDITFHKYVPKLLTRKIFGTCYKGESANTGLYMGYVKELKILLSDVLCEECKDDQVLINSRCSRYKFVKIDINEEIFKNINNSYDRKNLQNVDALFVQMPGQITFNRFVKRGVIEYSQFFLSEVISVLLVLTCILIYYKKYMLSVLIIVIFTLLYLIMDRSCIKMRCYNI
jgi:hypothetical protein